jgi:hypothetical protein
LCGLKALKGSSRVETTTKWPLLGEGLRDERNGTTEMNGQSYEGKDLTIHNI